MAISTGMSDGDSGFGGGGYGGGYGDSDGGYSGGGFGGDYGGNTDSLGGNLGIGPGSFGGGGGNSNQNWNMDVDGLLDGTAYGMSPVDTSFNFMGPSYDASSNLSQMYSPAVPQEQSWMDSPFVQNMKKLGMFALSMNPTTRPAMMAYNAYNALNKGEYGQAVGNVVGGLTGNGLLGAGLGLGVDAAMGKDIGKKALGLGMSAAGGYVGGQLAGPLGAQVGSQLGGYAARTPGINSGAQGQSSTMSGGGGRGVDWGQVGAGLGSLWASNQQARAASANTQDLSSMFGPNSAYAQTMRKELERKDAAGGRRSQYGAREVELQAKLAQMAAQYGPNIAQQNMRASEAKQQARNQQLNTLYALARQSGLVDQLSGMFKTPPAISPAVPTNIQYPTFDSGDSWDASSYQA